MKWKWNEILVSGYPVMQNHKTLSVFQRSYVIAYTLNEQFHCQRIQQKLNHLFCWMDMWPCYPERCVSQLHTREKRTKEKKHKSLCVELNCSWKCSLEVKLLLCSLFISTLHFNKQHIRYAYDCKTNVTSFLDRAWKKISHFSIVKIFHTLTIIQNIIFWVSIFRI